METVKFTFTDDFSPEDGGSTYSNKLQKVSDDAHTQGKEQGYTEALSSIEKNCETLLQSIQGSISVIMEQHEEHVAIMEKNATSLVLAIIQKLAPAIVNQKPLTEIENLVHECMRNNPLEPRLVIRVDEQMLPHLRKKIDIIQTESDYHGQVVLVSESMTNVSDCRVEWLDGGAERDFDGLMNSIEETVQVFINAPLPSGETMEQVASNAGFTGLPEENEN